MTAYSTNEILGLQSALDPRKVPKPHIVSGKNFYIDIEGPRSGFAYESSTPDYPLYHKNFVQTFRVTDDILFYVGQNLSDSTYGIYTFDWTLRRIIPVFEGSITNAYLRFPWTYALVGGYHYFAHRGVGVWLYDELINSWADVTADFPTGTYFILESAGRAIAMADGLVAVSAIDDASDFTPSIATGAGFQALSLIGSVNKPTDYLGLKKLADGFLAFTTRGALKGTIIDSVSPFRYDPIASKHVPMNPWSFAEIEDDIHIVLTQNGLYSAENGQLVPWNPVFSEYLKQRLLPSIRQSVSGLVQLYYDPAFQLLFVSFSPSIDTVIFTKSFCLYVPIGQWGSFDTSHTGFVNIDQVLNTKELSFGCVLADGTVAVFTNSTGNVQNEGGENSFLWGPRLEIPAFLQNTVLYFSDVCKGLEPHPVVDSYDSNFIARTGMFPAERATVNFPRYYPLFNFTTAGEFITVVNEEVADYIFPDICRETSSLSCIPPSDAAAIRVQETDMRPSAIMESSLNAEIEIGLFRFNDTENVEELTTVHELFLGVDASSGSITIDDWMAQTAETFDDWMNDYPTDVIDDWGQGFGTGAVFVESVIGTKDGKTAFENQTVEFELLDVEDGVRRSVGECSGIWHKLRIVATEVGHNFHLKLIEFNYFFSGRW